MAQASSMAAGRWFEVSLFVSFSPPLPLVPFVPLTVHHVQHEDELPQASTQL
jgi:hypothetical protein